MRILCILDKLSLLKTIKNCSADNDFDLKIISADDNFETYFSEFEPNVIVLQAEYEEVTIKFLVKLLKDYPAYQNTIKLLIVAEEQINPLAAFAKDQDILLIEEASVGIALCTKVKALYKNSIIVADTSSDEHLNRRKQILYVSDNKFMHIIVKDAFLNNAIEFLDAYDGDEALEKLKIHRPDLILTDMDIPGLSGIDLCKTVKQSNVFNDIPVVIYSSYMKQEVYDTCMDAGATEYYEKNINPKDLVDELRKFLN